jgi:integrase
MIFSSFGRAPPIRPQNRRGDAGRSEKGWFFMASISTSSNGTRTVQFVGQDGKRRSIRLGKVPLKTAEEVRRRVEYLLAANVSGTAPDGDTMKWLASIGDGLHARLAAVSLAKEREAVAKAKLKPFIDAYIAGRTDAKPQTLLNLTMFGDRLVAFFGPDRDITTIKRSDADAWLVHLKGAYAPATVGRTVKGARQLFKAACRADLLPRNPFEDLKAGAPPDKDRQCFITQEDTARVLEACPDYQWRLIVALSRYGGLRCPSEHLALTWPDVDWERERFRVTSPKTEHHEGKGERWVPIFPELRPYLEEAWERAPEGAVHVITIKRDAKQNLRTRFMKIIRRAGLTPWPKLFQNLRASRETELAERFPMHVVCVWLGNSQLIAAKHYLQVTEEHFERAAKSGAVGVQKAVQQPAA